ncbi:MAG: ABC transporter [Bacteroidetes bacterium]|nr:ABC transporter [Bacteroidota bacterium]
MIIIRLINESFLFALQSIRVNKVRTLLSLLGITIGIFSVISVFTVFDSMERSIKSSIDELGDNVLFVQKWPWAMGGDYPWWKYWQRPEPKLAELAEIQRKSNTIESASFMIAVNRTVKYLNNSIENAVVVAASHDYDKTMTVKVEEGRYFTAIESASGKNVVIIGAEISEVLFNGLDPIGRKIKIFGRNVEVIGVREKEGEDLFGNTSDDQLLIPINFARSLVDIRNTSPSIIVRARPNITNDEMRDELTGILRASHRLKPSEDDDFAINETDIITKGFEDLFRIVGMVGWVIGGFSLLVGGFGIANIMFVSVKERTNQIGIQKSLGAKNYFILFQFLFEAVFLSLFGGIVGLLIILLLVVLVNSQGMALELVLTNGNIILGMGVSIFIGLISGIIPARNASRLNPVEAMRSTF